MPTAESSRVYPHQDLGEPLHVDGSPVIRPVVPLVVAPGLPAVLGVLVSGSPVSVANADLFGWLGIDIEHADPVYEMPLSVGGGFESTPVFEVELRLRPPGESTTIGCSSLRLDAESQPEIQMPTRRVGAYSPGPWLSISHSSH